MKSLIKKFLCLAMVVLIAMPATIFAAASFEAYASASTVKPGETFTVYVGGQCDGRVDLSVSNGTLSTNMVWLDYNKPAQAVTVTAGQSGSVKVIATPIDMATPDAEEYYPNPVTIIVTIVQPSNPIIKPEEKPVETPTDQIQTPSQEENDEVDKPTEDSKEEIEEPKEDVPTKDPEDDEPGCFMHWIILLAAFATAVIGFVMKDKKKIGIICMAVYSVIAIVLVIMGSCNLDWMIAFGGLVVVSLEAMLLNDKKAE